MHYVYVRTKPDIQNEIGPSGEDFAYWHDRRAEVHRYAFDIVFKRSIREFDYNFHGNATYHQNEWYFVDLPCKL